MRTRTFSGVLGAIALCASFAACAPEHARAEGRRLGYLGLTCEGVHGEPRGLLGVEGMLGFKPHAPFWIVGAVSFQFPAESRYAFGGQPVNLRMLHIAAGPQVMHPWGRFRLVGHALAAYTEVAYADPGSAAVSVASGPAGASPAPDVGGRPARPLMASGYFGGPGPSLVDLGGFGFVLGMGVDVLVGRRSAIRILQLEYMPSRLRTVRESAPSWAIPNTPSPEESRFAEQVAGDHRGWTHGFRVSVGFLHGPERYPEPPRSVR